MTTSVTTNHALDKVRAALESVKDPEIPPISIVELGMIAGVSIAEGAVVVKMTPTFAGCPALDVLRRDIREAVVAAGFNSVRVEVVYDPPWTTDRITPEGLRKLKEFGLAPPVHCGSAGLTHEALAQAACPFCDSTDTVLESIFGPTLCRAIHYCNGCRQSFEQFKPVQSEG